MKSCLLCGVGGQGTVLASRIMASAAMEKGLFARTAETIGMAQRGGSVVSHVRIGEYVPSPLIPAKGADVILGFEPGEVLRNLSFLKENGTVIVCPDEVVPITVSLSGSAYDGKAILDYLCSVVRRLVVLDSAEIIAACGNSRVVNVALLGALAESGVMGINVEEMHNALKKKVKPALLAMNEKALYMGAETIGREK